MIIQVCFFGGILLKRSKKISVLISLVLILFIALSAVSAADDVATEDVELTSVDEVQVADDTPTIDETYVESNDVVQTDTGDSSDYDVTSEEEVISDSTGLQDNSDNGGDDYEEAVVSNDANPKNGLKAEPLRADGDGTFTELYNAIRNGGTVTLNKSYTYNPSTDSALVNGMAIAADLTINGNGHTIDGAGVARMFIINGYTSTEWLVATRYHGYTYTFNNINFINAYSTALGGVITSQDYPNTIRISNCNFTDNQGYRGSAVYVSVIEPQTLRPVDTGSVTITGCIFKENYASNNGGVIYSGINYDRSSITLNNNVFVNNSASGYAKVVFFANSQYIRDINYNWWGQNAWNNNFVAQSNSNYLRPQYSYQAALSKTGDKIVSLTLALNGSSAPSGSTLPARNATFAIDSGAIIPEDGMFQGSIEATFAAIEDTTITATVDNQVLTLAVSKTPRENIGQLTITVANVILPNVAEIVVDSDVSGTFNVTIGDTTKEITLTNGHGALTWDALPEGQYFAVVTCVDSLFYNDKFAYTSFKVEKADVTISIEADKTAIEFGETVTITPTITPDTIVATDLTYYVDGNEASSATLTDLSVGTHTVVAKYAGDDNYNAAESNAVTVTVSKANPIIIVYASHNAYPLDAMITVNVCNQALVPLNGVNLRVTVNGVTYALETQNSGAILRLSGLNASEYPITVVSIANENYTSATNDTEKLIVEKADLTITAITNASSVPYGDSIGFDNTIRAPVGAQTVGAVTYYVDGEAITGDSISTLEIGDHTVVAKYSGDDNFNDAQSASVSFTVTKADPSLTISANATEINYPDSIKLSYTIKDGATGSVVYYLGEDPIEGDTLTRLAPGTYTVTASYEGNDYYNAVDSSNSLAITIGKGDVSIEVTADTYTIEYGDDLLISRAITPFDATGVVTYIVDGEETDNPLLSGLTVGIHTIAAKFGENVYWKGAISETKIVTVTKATPILYVGPGNETYPNDAVVVVAAYDKNWQTLDGITVKVTVGGITYAIETISGGNYLIIKGLNVGVYPITAVTVANENYVSVSNDTQSLEIYKGNLTITAVPSASSVVMGDEISFTNTITAPEGAVTSGTVTYYVDGDPISGDSISTLSVGPHSVVVKYTGDPNFNDAQSTAVPFTVTEAAIVVTGQNASVVYPNKGNIVITTNVAGTYTIKVGDVTYEDVALVVGENIFPVTDVLSVGSHAVKVSANIDDYQEITDVSIAIYTVTKGDLTIAVNPNATNIKYGESVTLSNTISLPEGTVAAGTVTYYLDGVAITGNTLTGLSVGTHNLAARYTGDPNFNDAESASKTITVGKATPYIVIYNGYATYPNNATTAVWVTDDDIRDLEGIIVKVTVNNVEYVVVTNENGIAEFTTKDLNAGVYPISAVSIANENYEAATYTEDAKITIIKATATVTSGDVTVIYPANGKVNITASVAGTYKVKVGNDEYTAIVSTAGETVSVDIPTLDVGDYGISVTADLGNNYNPVDTGVINTYTVSPGTIALTVEDVTVSYPNTGVVTVKADVDGEYDVIVNSRIYRAHVIDGEGSVTVQTLNPGGYNIRVQAVIDNYETFNEQVARYTVTKGTIDVTGQDGSATYPQTGSIAITTDVAGTYTIKVGEDYSKDVELEAGENTVSIDSILDAGTYEVSVSATIDGYSPVEDKVVATFTVNQGDVSINIEASADEITYGQTVTISPTVTPDTLIDQIKYYVDGNEASSATLTDLPVGTHTVIAKYAGSTNYKAAESNAVTITVAKATPAIEITSDPVTYPDDAIVNIALTGANNAALPGATIKVTVNGLTYAVTTDEEGKAKLTIKGLDANEYPIAAVSVADDSYESTTYAGEAKVTVNKATATVTSGDVTVIYPANGKVTITASVAGTYTVKVGNDEYTAIVTAAGGTATVDIPTLDVGEYGISVTADLGNNYNAVSTGVINTYTVSAGTIVVTGEGATVLYPNNATITVNTSVAGTYTIKIDGRSYDVALAIGENEVYVPYVLNPGNYPVFISANIPNYERISLKEIASYKVSKGIIHVTAQDISVTYPAKGTIAITVDVIGDYDITIGTKTYRNVHLSMGENSFEVPESFDAGTYEVSVSAAESNLYQALDAQNIATYTVSQAQSTIDVSYEDGEFTITLDGVDGEKLSETVKVAIDGTEIDPIVTENGVYELTYDTLAPGRHSILVSFDGNTNYLGDSKNYGFDVDMITPTLVVSIDNLVYGEDAYIIASLYDGETPLNGVVEVTIVETDTTFIVAVAEGSGILPIAGLDAGTYTYTAKSIADSTYASATQDEETFTVAPRVVLIEVDTFGGVDFGDEGEIEVRLYDAETDERIKDEVTLIFTDEDGNVLATTTVETIVGPWERGDKLDFTADWPMGDYYVTVENPNYKFVEYDESEYKFTSFGDEAGEIEYSTGTVEEIENDLDMWIIKVRVLTNDADESYVGKEYYIDTDAYFDTEQTYELMVYDGENLIGTGIWVLISKEIIPLDPPKYDYPVHKVGIGVNLVSGDGGYVYGYDHEVVLELIKYDGDDYEEGEPVEIDCPATIVVLKFNEETDEWEEIDTLTTLSFEDGMISIDCSDFKPGEYKLKVSISDDTYEIRYWNDEADSDVDYRMFWDYDPLFSVDNDNVFINNVKGEESTTFGYEHIFNFELWHSNWMIEDNEELFAYDTNSIVKVYKWDDEAEEYILIETYDSVAITQGKSADLDLSDLKVGRYKVTVTLDDAYYSFNEWDDEVGDEVDYAMRYFDIFQDNIHANVDGTYWTEYGQERIFKFDLTHWDDDAQKDVLFEYNTNAIVKVYKLTWDDEGVESPELIDTYPVAINGGHSAEIDLSSLNAGSYRVTIQLDDEDYALDYWFDGEYGIQEERFDVGRANVNITVEFDKPDGYVYGDDVTVTVTITPQTTDEKLTEEIELNIMGKESIRKNLTDGVATFKLEDYDAGLYTIWVNFKGTDNYNDIYNRIDSFIINKASPLIDVTPRKDEYAYGEDVIIDVTFKDGDNGLSATAIVTVDGTDYVVNIEDGEGTLSISGLDTNTEGYGIAATVAGTDNYNSASYGGDAKVVVVKSDDAKVDVKLEGDQILVSLTGVDDVPLDGTVMVSIDNGEAVEVTVTNGQGTIDASALTAGTHTVEATSVADDNYESVSISKEITKETAPYEAFITVSVDNIIYGQDAEVQVSLQDAEGNVVEGTLTVKVGETEREVYIGADGIGYVAFSDLTVDHYTATVSFAGDETYRPTSKEATFDVSKVATVIESEDIVVTANVAENMEFTLKDSYGNILAGRTVTLTFNGQTFERTSDEDGKFTVEISMANQGTYTISASYAGEDNYEASSASYNVVVKPIATKLTVEDVTYGLSETKYLTAKLTVGDEPLANKIVTFSLNGKTYTGRTNSEGVVRIAVSLTAKKTYSVVASYGGDTTYGSAMAIYKLKVVKS